MTSDWAQFFLTLILAIASTLAIVTGWFFFFFKSWFERYLEKIIEKKNSDRDTDYLKFKKKSINITNKLISKQVEYDRTQHRLAKDFWKTKMHSAQIMEWGSKLNKDRVYPFVPSKRAIESFDDYWGEIKLDLDNLQQDPFESKPEK